MNLDPVGRKQGHLRAGDDESVRFRNFQGAPGPYMYIIELHYSC